MFGGFTDRTFEFFMAIRFNNNREFFHSNHDWYVESVRTPMLELCRDLAEMMVSIDPMIETRAEKCVCRVNRDTRFSKDKSPYRDYSFFAFRRLSGDSGSIPGFYFDLSDEYATYGMGFYDKNMAMMNAFRELIARDPDGVLECVRPAMKRFQLVGKVIKRMSVPPEIPDELKPWYPLRGFYVTRELRDFELLKSPKLVDELKNDYMLTAKLYKALFASDQ